MNKYIDFNTKKRLNAFNNFENNFFKLIVNSFYQKTMENLQKRNTIRLITNEKVFLKYTSKPTHITHKMFDRNFATIYDIDH